jgi:hypothetical protein
LGITSHYFNLPLAFFIMGSCNNNTFICWLSSNFWVMPWDNPFSLMLQALTILVRPLKCHGLKDSMKLLTQTMELSQNVWFLQAGEVVEAIFPYNFSSKAKPSSKCRQIISFLMSNWMHYFWSQYAFVVKCWSQFHIPMNHIFTFVWILGTIFLVYITEPMYSNNIISKLCYMSSCSTN